MHPIFRAFPRGLLSLPRRRAFWRTEAFEPIKPGLGTPEVIVSRGRCRFSRFDLSRLPPPKRASALALQLPGWSPFIDTDYAIAWSDAGWAAVWAWSRSDLAAALSAHDLTERGLRYLPETTLRGRGADGVRLLQGLDGFEAQYWLDGDLLASRWWPSPPDAAALVAFQRDCGLGADTIRTQIEPTQTELADKPWTPLSPVGGGGGLIAAPELVVYGVLALALGVPGLALAVDQLRLVQARSEARDELARESERSKGVLTARDAALAAADQLKALRDLNPYPAPLVQMTAVARALPEDGSVWVREWDFSDGKLRLLLSTASGEIGGSEHVRALEQTGMFTELKVLTQADPRQMAFTMSVKPHSALNLVAEPAPGASTPVRD